ncbi:MAG: ethanolamine utilization protein EutN [Candidatus Sericytochromatia bacterium]|nr:MAG: ethanolamine utilization protein EutN [Candidatus Sericytochromatia bacterium]
MEIAKVIGNLVSTQKVNSLVGVKLMIVQQLDKNFNPIGNPAIATDATGQAGIGEVVFIESGREAALALENKFNPSDLSIIGIVDNTYINKNI